MYSTYIGGSDVDAAPTVALDRFGDLYIEGLTFSADYPTTPGAFQTAAGGNGDTYVTKSNPVALH